MKSLSYLLSISGWGDTGVQETSTDKLQETVFPIVQSSNCIERMTQTEGVNEDLIVCAGGAESGGPCKVNHKLFTTYKFLQFSIILTQGDSGGPLTTTNEEGAHILVGIVSKRLGESCSQQDYAIFTSVSAHLPWIESLIKENGGMASCTFNFSALPTLGILIHMSE